MRKTQRRQPSRRRHLTAGALCGALAAVLSPASLHAQFPSWTKHAAVSAGLTLTSQFVLKEPWVGGGVAVGLNVGHEIGQARVRHRWTADNTRDLVGGTVTAVVASLLLHRYVATPPRPEAAGLRPLTPSASLRSWYERLAQCLARPSLFPQVRWFTSTADSSHQHVVVLNADSVTSVSAVTRSLLPHFERSDDRERNAAATRCVAEKQHPPL